MAKIMGKFMNQVMTEMQKQLGSQIGDGMAISGDMASTMKSVFSVNPSVFAKAFSLNMDETQMAALFSQFMNNGIVTYDSILK